jgi:hypothetical protein
MQPAAGIGHTSHMTVAGSDWEKRVSELWTEMNRYDEDEFAAASMRWSPSYHREARSGCSSVVQRSIPPVAQIGRFCCTQPRSTQAWWASVAGELSSRWPARSGTLGIHKTHRLS